MECFERMDRPARRRRLLGTHETGEAGCLHLSGDRSRLYRNPDVRRAWNSRRASSNRWNLSEEDAALPQFDYAIDRTDQTSRSHADRGLLSNCLRLRGLGYVGSPATAWIV